MDPWGPDVFAGQKVASRFTVGGSGDLQLARIGLHLMNNSDTTRATLRLSLQTDALDEGGSQPLPSGSELENSPFPLQAPGWNPVEQIVNAVYGPALQAGRNYGVVAKPVAGRRQRLRLSRAAWRVRLPAHLHERLRPRRRPRETDGAGSTVAS